MTTSDSSAPPTNGTLFLDEVGDLPLEAQAKLLRVLQSKEVLPLGATNPETVDVRIICATHRDLGVMQQEGRFRGDLFARLNEYSVTLPPLRARKEDIFALCSEFLRLHKRPDLELSVPYMTGLLHYDFPYNVRELEALIKRGIALVEGGELGASNLSAEIHARMRTYGQRVGQTFRWAPRPHQPDARLTLLASAPRPPAAHRRRRRVGLTQLRLRLPRRDRIAPHLPGRAKRLPPPKMSCGRHS